MALNQQFINAFRSGLGKLEDEAVTPEPHWYPCGFAWLAIKHRKNGPLSATFKHLGWRWNDYEKAYTYSMPASFRVAPNMGQSMDYAARCLGALGRVLSDQGGVQADVITRID